MARYSVGIIGLGLKAFPHVRCFEDFARGIAEALRILGHEVVPITDSDPGRVICFGANNIVDPDGKFPADAIVYNPEQVASAVGSHLMQNRARFARHVIWDYSQANADALRRFGMERVVLCPVGYVSSMRTIVSAEEEDVDVLHYGSVNPRRRAVLERLQREGFRVKHLFGVYGAERDAWIARAKVVLNLHYYDRPIFEIFRVSHLLANRRAVVSEDGGQDPALEDFAARATRLVPYDDVVEACRELVGDEGARRDLAERGHEAFKEIDLVDSVRRALKVS